MLTQRFILLSTLLIGAAGTALRAQDPGYEDVILEDEPRAYYRFEEELGELELLDSSGNDHHSLQISPSVQLEAEGKVDSGIEFLGDGNVVLDFLMNPADPEGDGVGVGNDDFSIEVLVKPSVVATNQVFISNQNGTGLGRSNCLITSGGVFGSFTGGGTTASGVPPAADTWYHYVLTYDISLSRTQPSPDSGSPPWHSSAGAPSASTVPRPAK